MVQKPKEGRVATTSLDDLRRVSVEGGVPGSQMSLLVVGKLAVALTLPTP